MPAAVAIPALIGAGGSIASGIIGSKAANSAANTQAAAAGQAANLATIAGQQSASQVEQQGNIATSGIDSATTEAQQLAINSAGRSSGILGMSVEQANNLLRMIYGSAIGDLNDYKATGTNAIAALNAGLIDPNGEFNKQFTTADLENDPGYQFRMQEAQKAFERSAAARGSTYAGGTMKALNAYVQGEASREVGAAFDRFRAGQTDRYSRLRDIAGIGLTATNKGIDVGENYAGRAAGNIMSGGKSIADILYTGDTDAAKFGMAGATTSGQMRLNTADLASRYRMQGTGQAIDAITGGAAAKAAGTIGAANAWGGALGGVANAASGVGNYYTLRNIFGSGQPQAKGGRAFI